MCDNRSNIVAFFADQGVGLQAVRYVLERYPWQIKCVVTISNNEIAEMAKSFGCRILYYEEITAQNAKEIFSGVELIFLAWWPKIIPSYIIDTPKVGIVNFHPSFLPYNRGKNYNFWTIVENTPFGVTLHFVDEAIDSGDILFQTPIEKNWEDTGGTLYLKAQSAIILLFKNRYLDIIEGRYTRTKQDTSIGKVHYFKELDMASEINLDKYYNAKELFNLLRARTFEGKPGCFFLDDGKKYEVRVSIKEVDSGTD